ncbi:Hypothetical protein CINCED_3A025406 [Cinara cedri]|uniref:Uncharacterized protein n=1 Tax=Cinara cedri TaxID=506608 RepID=A0A5E4MLQ8_9HEMI|nr:Hypothetical protein CINCED_3A025406 [Cinara cedri]
MNSQRWVFTSPGGEDEYKKPSVTQKNYDAVIEALAREKSAETENERKRREFENLMWQRMTDSVKVSESNKSQQQQNFDKLKKLNCSSSTYRESFVINGFEVKELGSEINEKVGY